MVTMKDHHNCCYAGGEQCYYVMDCAIATVEHVMYSSYWQQHLLLSFIPQRTKLPGRTITPVVGNNICYWSSYYKEWSCEGRSICIGYQVETLCGNNTDCFKLWDSYVSQWHPVLPQVTTHPASVNHTRYRTIGVHVVTSKELSSRGLMSQQAHTSPLQNH